MMLTTDLVSHAAFCTLSKSPRPYTPATGMQQNSPWHATLMHHYSLSHMSVLQALVHDKAFKKHVVEYAKDQDKYFEDFAAAYEKLLHLGVPVNHPGQHAPA